MPGTVCPQLPWGRGRQRLQEAGGWSGLWGAWHAATWRKKEPLGGQCHLADVLRALVLGPGLTEDLGTRPGPCRSPIVCTPQRSELLWPCMLDTHQ